MFRFSPSGYSPSVNYFHHRRWCYGSWFRNRDSSEVTRQGKAPFYFPFYFTLFSYIILWDTGKFVTILQDNFFKYLICIQYLSLKTIFQMLYDF